MLTGVGEEQNMTTAYEQRHDSKGFQNKALTTHFGMIRTDGKYSNAYFMT